MKSKESLSMFFFGHNSKTFALIFFLNKDVYQAHDFCFILSTDLVSYEFRGSREEIRLELLLNSYVHRKHRRRRRRVCLGCCCPTNHFIILELQNLSYDFPLLFKTRRSLDHEALVLQKGRPGAAAAA